MSAPVLTSRQHLLLRQLAKTPLGRAVSGADVSKRTGLRAVRAELARLYELELVLRTPIVWLVRSATPVPDFLFWLSERGWAALAQADSLRAPCENDPHPVCLPPGAPGAKPTRA